MDDTDKDIIVAIQSKVARSLISWKTHYVKGHQDQNSQKLDEWAQLNIAMDAKAKLFWRRTKALLRHQTIQDEPWPIWILDRKVTSNISTSIYTYIHNYQGDQYWLTKPDVNKVLLKEVDWTATEVALQSIPRQRRVFLMKHVCGMCGVGKFMQRWKEWQHDSCPRCGTREDASHVWLCQGQDKNLLLKSTMGEGSHRFS